MNNNIKMMEMQIEKIAKKKFEYWKEKFVKDILNKIDKKIKGTFMTKELSYNDIEEIIKNESGFNK